MSIPVCETCLRATSERSRMPSREIRSPFSSPVIELFENPKPSADIDTGSEKNSSYSTQNVQLFTSVSRRLRKPHDFLRSFPGFPYAAVAGGRSFSIRR